jgi:glyoxylase-like metal-dependent hydrolase (beta-lactamase superfamily II)
VKILIAALLAFVAVVPAYSQQPDWCKTRPSARDNALKRVLPAEPWFVVYQLPDSVFAIAEPRQSEDTIGYLIVGKQRALLFDTGMGIADLKKLVAQVISLPLIVLNSHTHNDHVGGNWQFSTVWSLDTDFSRKNAEGSTTDAQAEIQPSELCGNLPAGFDPGTYATQPWKIAKYIHDGEQIDLGGRSVEVIATPGHTPDAISLYDQANGLLFTGDTFYPGTLWLYRPETDLTAYDKSIHRLAALAPHVKSVLGAHDFPLSPPTVLPNLVKDFEFVQAGKIAATPAGPGKVTYKADSVSFLMHAKD